MKGWRRTSTEAWASDASPQVRSLAYGTPGVSPRVPAAWVEAEQGRTCSSCGASEDRGAFLGLKGEPLTRETASKTDENDSLLPHER